MQRNPMESPDALVYLQMRCRKQGEALAHQFTVRGVFGDGGAAGSGCMIEDHPELEAGWAAAQQQQQQQQQQQHWACNAGAGAGSSAVAAQVAAPVAVCAGGSLAVSAGEPGGAGSGSFGSVSGSGEQPPSPGPRVDSIALMGSSAEDMALVASLARVDSDGSANLASMAVEAT